MGAKNNNRGKEKSTITDLDNMIKLNGTCGFGSYQNEKKISSIFSILQFLKCDTGNSSANFSFLFVCLIICLFG